MFDVWRASPSVPISGQLSRVFDLLGERCTTSSNHITFNSQIYLMGKQRQNQFMINGRAVKCLRQMVACVLCNS